MHAVSVLASNFIYRKTSDKSPVSVGLCHRDFNVIVGDV